MSEIFGLLVKVFETVVVADSVITKRGKLVRSSFIVFLEFENDNHYQDLQ